MNPPPTPVAVNRRRFLAASGALSLLALAGLPACSKAGRTAAGGGGAGADVDYYTCAMHPSVHLHDPKAKCPVCGMNLVPVAKRGGSAAPAAGVPGAAADDQAEAPGHDHDHEFRVPVERQQQIGVTYATVTRAPLRRQVRAAGVVVPDKGRRWGFVARVDGYVERLAVTSPGEPVAKDQPLLSVYSPEVRATERELVGALQMRDQARAPEVRATAQRLVDGAKQRLEQWNVTAAQTAELARTRRPAEFLTLRSPFDGVVETVTADQGRAVKAGDPLVSVVDLSVVWVWAEFYENELPLLRRGQPVTVTTASLPGQRFAGQINFVDPFLDEAKRTARVRVDIANPGRQLRPAMYVDAALEVDGGPGLTVPVGAVLPTGTRTVVFVDRGAGRLEPRPIRLGDQFGERYEVRDGLAEGERVVAGANFLIDAEARLQGALRSFEEPTATAAAGAATTAAAADRREGRP